MSDFGALEIFKLDNASGSGPNTSYSDVMNENRIIFNSENYPDTYTTSDKTTARSRADFDVPDNKSRLEKYSVDVNRSDTDNPAPYQEETRKPDTGFRGLRYELSAVFMPGGEGLERLVEWYKETSDVRGAFKNGRFGIINEHAPEFNITPTNAHGLKFTRLRIEHDIAFGIKRAHITLEQSGTAAGIAGDAAPTAIKGKPAATPEPSP